MQVKEPIDTNSSSATTQALLRDGAIREAQKQKPLRCFGTAVVVGTAAIGGQGYSPGTIPTEASHFAHYEEIGVPRSGIEEEHRPPAITEPLRLDTDNAIPAELLGYLRPSLESAVDEFAAELGEDDYDLNARLVPPRMEEYQMRVRFRLIGDESPRIWTDADLE